MLKYRLFKIRSVNLSPNSTNGITTFPKLLQKQLVHDLDPDPIFFRADPESKWNGPWALVETLNIKPLVLGMEDGEVIVVEDGGVEEEMEVVEVGVEEVENEEVEDVVVEDVVVEDEEVEDEEEMGEEVMDEEVFLPDYEDVK